MNVNCWFCYIIIFIRLVASPLNLSTTLFQLSAPSSLALLRCTAKTAADERRSSLVVQRSHVLTLLIKLKLRSQPAVPTGIVMALMEHSNRDGRAASYGVNRVTISERHFGVQSRGLLWTCSSQASCTWMHRDEECPFQSHSVQRKASVHPEKGSLETLGAENQYHQMQHQCLRGNGALAQHIQHAQ